MTRHTLSRALLALAIAAPLCAHSSPLGTKPGEWEITASVVYSNIPNAKEKLANIPPKQRAKIIRYYEEFKSREGKPVTSITRKCVKASETMASLTENHPDKDGCTRKVIRKTATAIEVTESCVRPARKARIRVEAKSPESVSTNVDIDFADGMKMHKEAKSRWIGTSCDDLYVLPPGVKRKPIN